MRRLVIWFAILMALAVVGTALAQEPLPQPQGYVNDFANVIAGDVETGLEESLRLFEEETTVELVVVTVPTLGGDTVEGYAVRLFQQWSVGQRGEDNGVLLLLAVEDRAVRIEVGYGLEPYLTDGQTGRILDAQVLPALRQGSYALGILNGVQAVVETIKGGGYQPGAVRARPSAPGVPSLPSGNLGYLALMGIMGVFMYLASFMARSRSFWLGGVLGLVGGGVLGWFLGGVVLLIVAALGFGLLGLVLDAILSSAYVHQKSTGRPTRWTGSMGGFSGAGRGGWTGGKSFGGFGGGRSGGGGASRRF